jgi:hypothetical protein
MANPYATGWVGQEISQSGFGQLLRHRHGTIVAEEDAFFRHRRQLNLHPAVADRKNGAAIQAALVGVVSTAS